MIFSKLCVKFIHCKCLKHLKQVQDDLFFISFRSELIRNQTLKFLSRTLPILKADNTLPKVTQIVENDLIDGANQRTFEDDDNGQLNDDYEPDMTEKRSRTSRQIDPNRNTRKFCDGGGVFCALYRAIQGEPINSQLIAERREETVAAQPQFQGPPV